MEFDGTAVGIDLGTTKSCIAVARFEDGELVCECQTIDEPGQPEGQIAVPSVVAVKDGEAIVGHAARRLARTPRFFQHKGSFSGDQERDRTAAHLRACSGRLPVGHGDCRPHHRVSVSSIRAGLANHSQTRW
ncbi:MAG: Hsp70 family protein [Rhodanobacteraceae bacterium]|nr:Hsp70 family protein [Rhodanobacteraceae bacterium]